MSKRGQIDSMRYEPGIGLYVSGSETIARWNERSKDAGMHSVELPSVSQQEGCVIESISVEVFYCPNDYTLTTDDGILLAPGWYWWPCMPDCRPDAEAMGPFASSTIALDNAKEEYAE